MAKKKSVILKAAIVDVETTGLKTSDEIVELTIILFAFNRETGERLELLDEYTGLREPGCKIDPIAAKKHGLTLDVLRGQCLDDGRVRALIEQADYLIAHNASFDRRFIGGLYPDLPPKKWLCTVQSFNWHSKGYPNEKLETLLKGHGIVRANAHRAGDDARALMELIFLTDANTQKPYFAELLQVKPLGRPRTRPEARPQAAQAPTAISTVNDLERHTKPVYTEPVINPAFRKRARKWNPWQIGMAVFVLGSLGCLGLSILGRLLGY